MVLKGLELDRGDWTVYANEPDLDTLFAIWVLLNHRRVKQLTPDQRDSILPLLHLDSYRDQIKIDYVTTDGFRAGEMVVDHLVGLGHRRIVFMA